MLDDMLTYTAGTLSSIAEFLASEPIIYIFGFFLGATVIKIIKEIGGF